MELEGRIIKKGNAEGIALVSKTPVSFFGCVDYKTGVVMEKGHELEGVSIKDKILVFPYGKGSTVGSYALYRMKKEGSAPAAIINQECEPIVAVGAIISEIPCVDKVDISKIKTGNHVEVRGNVVSIGDPQDGKMERGLIVVKLGGSVITLKDDGKPEVNMRHLSRLCREIAEAKREKDFSLVVVHGAGPFGHVPAKKYGLDKGLASPGQVKGISETHQSMEKLNYIVVEELRRNGMDAISFQPSSGGMLRDGKLIKFPVDVMDKMLRTGLVPVSYGDVLIDEQRGAGILSGDHLVPYLARELSASRVLLVADVPGLFDSDPKKNRKAKLLKEVSRKNIHEINEVSGARGVDVTGGMARKLDELLGLADCGIESEVIDGRKIRLLKRALLGERGLGTIIKYSGLKAGV